MNLIRRIFGTKKYDDSNWQTDEILNPANMKSTGGWRIVMKNGSIEDYEADSWAEAIRMAKNEGRRPLNE